MYLHFYILSHFLLLSYCFNSIFFHLNDLKKKKDSRKKEKNKINFKHVQ